MYFKISAKLFSISMHNINKLLSKNKFKSNYFQLRLEHFFIVLRQRWVCFHTSLDVFQDNTFCVFVQRQIVKLWGNVVYSTKSKIVNGQTGRTESSIPQFTKYQIIFFLTFHAQRQPRHSS